MDNMNAISGNDLQGGENHLAVGVVRPENAFHFMSKSGL
jgi:hypothetical protein